MKLENIPPLLAALSTCAMAQPLDPKPLGERGAPMSEARKLTPDEERAYQLALAYGDAQEPLLDCHQLAPQLTLDRATSIWTVQLWAVPKGEEGRQHWRCGTVGFKVLVSPDGTVSESKWRIRSRW